MTKFFIISKLSIYVCTQWLEKTKTQGAKFLQFHITFSSIPNPLRRKYKIAPLKKNKNPESLLL